jgi:hypothetical protein
MDELAAGAVLQERYRVVRLLKAGGMGAVYEARDQRLHTTVALKQTLVRANPKTCSRPSRIIALEEVCPGPILGGAARVVYQDIALRDIGEVRTKLSEGGHQLWVTVRGNHPSPFTSADTTPARPARIGERYTTVLSSRDYWKLQGAAGQCVQIEMRSTAVDAYLDLREGTPAGARLAHLSCLPTLDSHPCEILRRCVYLQ